MFKIRNFIRTQPTFNNFHNRVFKPSLPKHGYDMFIKTKPIDDSLLYSEILADLNYKQNIITASGIPHLLPENLKSITGPNELRHIIKKQNNNRSFYIPGERPDNKLAEPDSYKLENVVNKIFGGSMHIHTKHSDGQLSVLELLNQAAKYGDEYAKKHKQPFIIGITDHNTAEGCKEAVRILAQNPDKYKNIRVTLGTEISTKENELYNHNLKKPLKFHILALCINPFKKETDKFFSELNEGRKNPMFPKQISIKEVVDAFKNEQETYFSFAHPAYPNIRKFIEQNENPYEVTKSVMKHFKDIAGDKALYAETYYAGYYGDVALDKNLHDVIKSTCDELKLYKSGGIDTHGQSIFYNGVKELKKKNVKK